MYSYDPNLSHRDLNEDFEKALKGAFEELPEQTVQSLVQGSVMIALVQGVMKHHSPDLKVQGKHLHVGPEGVFLLREIASEVQGVWHDRPRQHMLQHAEMLQAWLTATGHYGDADFIDPKLN